MTVLFLYKISFKNDTFVNLYYSNEKECHKDTKAQRNTKVILTTDYTDHTDLLKKTL